MGTLRNIGVLGGMGPEATVLFMQRMIASIEATDDRDHIPLLVDSNTQVPSRIDAILNGTGKNPGPTLKAMAQRLENAGAEALAMPCNTAHHFASIIEGAVSIPFLNMVDLSIQSAALELGEGGRIGVLGSPALRVTGVFEGAAENHHLKLHYPEDEETLVAIIKDVKSRGPSAWATAHLSTVAAQLVEEGAELVMVCCSEFSLLAEKIQCNAPIFDTLDELVRACVQFSVGEVQSPNATALVQPVYGSSTGSNISSTRLLRKETAQC